MKKIDCVNLKLGKTMRGYGITRTYHVRLKWIVKWIILLIRNLLPQFFILPVTLSENLKSIIIIA